MIALYVDGRVNLDASLEDVETAIHSLDGSQCTLVVVELASGKTITIGGGPSKVVAELSENDTHRWCVVDPPARICIAKEAQPSGTVIWPERIMLLSNADAVWRPRTVDLCGLPF